MALAPTILIGGIHLALSRDVVRWGIRNVAGRSSFSKRLLSSIVLCCCLISSLSFADVPLHENQPTVPPAIDLLLGIDRHADTDPMVGRDEATPPCFSAGNQLGALRSGSTLEWPERSTLYCLAANTDEMGWSGYEAQGDHAQSLENWLEAEKGYTMAVGVLDRAPDKDINQDLAALLNKLGIARFKQNDFVGAETVFRRALTIFTLTRGADNHRVADTLDLVASALFQQPQGRVLAGPLFYRAWVIRERTLVPDHPAIADSLHHVAVSLYFDNISAAVPLFLRSKEIREKVFGHDHQLVAHTLNTMALVYTAHDRRDLAIPLFQEALAIQEKVFGPNASETLQVRYNLDMADRGDNHPHDQLNDRK
jgi:tetratricopeptide (TPR) repeat protein